MNHSPSPMVMKSVQQLGVAEVARRLGVSRFGLLGYCAGRCRETTREYIETRVPRLDPAPGTP